MDKPDWSRIRQEKNYFICKGCMETITKPENYSKEPNICMSCYLQRQALENNKCIQCSGPNPEKQYWGMCKKCFDKPETDKDFEEAMKLEQIEDEFGWEAAQDYLDKKKEKDGKR